MAASPAAPESIRDRYRVGQREKQSAFRAATTNISAATKTSLLEEARVNAVIAAAKVPLLVGEKAVKEHISAVSRMTDTALIKAHQQAFQAQAIKLHTEKLTQITARTAAAVTTAMGFTVTQQTNNNMLRIIGVDKIGRALVSEIRVDKNSNVESRTEVLGVTDATCSALLDKFQEQMALAGVALGNAKRRKTGPAVTLKRAAAVAEAQHAAVPTKSTKAKMKTSKKVFAGGG